MRRAPEGLADLFLKMRYMISSIISRPLLSFNFQASCVQVLPVNDTKRTTDETSSRCYCVSSGNGYRKNPAFDSNQLSSHDHDNRPRSEFQGGRTKKGDDTNWESTNARQDLGRRIDEEGTGDELRSKAADGEHAWDQGTSGISNGVGLQITEDEGAEDAGNKRGERCEFEARLID